MKIEKISDTQIKLTLSKDDLDGKDIKLEDLTTSAEKAQELFHDILSKALDECGFSVDEAPLMVEAMPVNSDSIMIIVTRIDAEESSSECPCNGCRGEQPPLPIISKDLHRYKINSIKEHESDISDGSCISIYSFKALDDAIDACIRTAFFKYSDSSLYKYINKYYLVLQSEEDIDDAIECAGILNEYGDKEKSNLLAKFYLVEHGETLVAENAVEILAENFK